MNLSNNIFIYVLEYSSILTFSFLLHFFIFSSIGKGYLGDPLREFFNFILYKKQNILIILIFFVCLILTTYLTKNVVYLDDKISVTTTIENVKFEISGELVKSCFNNIGAVGDFTVGAKIATSVLAKTKTGILPKTGLIGGTGLGLTASFKLLNQTLFPTPSSIETVIVEANPIGVVTKVNNKTSSDLISEQFGIFKNLSKNDSINKIPENFTKDLQNNINFTTSSEDTAKFVMELDPQTPNWREQFVLSDFPINSPLESNNSLVQFMLDALNNHLIINFVTVYLLLMLLIILICKLMLNKEIKFNRLEKLPLGIYINNFLIKYISIWQKSGNFWIFSIIISLIFFNTVITFSTYHLILQLK